MPVCWAKPTYRPGGSGRDRGFVLQPDVLRLDHVLESLKGLHILISDHAARTKASGKYLDRCSNGMGSNYTLDVGARTVRRRRCPCLAVVSHEFGHTIGFIHEQNQRLGAKCHKWGGSDSEYNVTRYVFGSIELLQCQLGRQRQAKRAR